MTGPALFIFVIVAVLSTAKKTALYTSNVWAGIGKRKGGKL